MSMLAVRSSFRDALSMSGRGRQRTAHIRRIVVAAALVTCTSCAHTPVMSGPMRTSARLPAGAVVYDDSERTIPAGHELDVRFLHAVSSKTAVMNQGFEAMTASDLRNGPRVVVPAGSLVRGVVGVVQRADDAEGRGRLTLVFTALVANARSVVIDGTAARLFVPADARDDAHGVAVSPALVGGTLAALDEDLTMTVSSGGSIVAAEPGADAALAAGAIVRIRLNAAVEIR